MSISLDFLAFAFCLLVEGIRDLYKERINLNPLSCKTTFVQSTQLYRLISVFNSVGPKVLNIYILKIE